MSLLTFAIIIIILCAAYYLITRLIPEIPNAVIIVLRVVFALVALFLLLALFKLMPLPFNLT